jgi:hypothetical protein
MTKEDRAKIEAAKKILLAKVAEDKNPDPELLQVIEAGFIALNEVISIAESLVRIAGAAETLALPPLKR